MAKKNTGYEYYMQRLENIVDKLESGEISLEDSLKLYSEGTELAVVCDNKLKEAEEQIITIRTKSSLIQQ